MEYAYATCLLNESDEEINETNLVAVLDAAGCPVQESRVKAIVAALEDVDVGDVAGVDFDEVGSDPRHNGESPERQTGSSAEQNNDTEGATGSASGSELTAIETDPDSASRADDTLEAIADATDEDSTGDEFEGSGSPTPDDEV